MKTIQDNSNFAPFRRVTSFAVSLKNKTGFKIGGKADIFFEPVTDQQLIKGLNFFAGNGIPISILGGGQNVLISDEGVEGVTVSLKRLHRITHSGMQLTVEAGAKTEQVSKYCARHGLAGFEDFARLPGTVGGAVYMNARCYEKDICEHLADVTVLQFTGGAFVEKRLEVKTTDFAYKTSPFQKARSGIELLDGGTIILSATFNLAREKRRLLYRTRAERIRDRKRKHQFAHPSAGSTFKNNRQFGKSSGAIIDELGLKGLTVGKAQVAPYHGNFIINAGGATARDVRALIETVQQRVFEVRGFRLEPEVIFAGRWD